MSQAPLNIKLQCRSWQQLQNIYRRDLSRHAIFLKSSNPPPVGTQVRIDLTLPTESMIVLTGAVAEHVPPGGLGGRGPGIDIKLTTIPQSALWLIETALASAQKQAAAAAPTPAPPPAPDIGVEDSHDLLAAEDELTGALIAELASLRRLNPFQVMGVPYDADAAAVRAAFAELTRKYHPDRFTRYTSTQIRQLAAEIFIVIRDAYRRLADDASRARALAALGMRPSVKVPSRPELEPTAVPRSSAPTPASSSGAGGNPVAATAPTQRARTAPPVAIPSLPPVPAPRPAPAAAIPTPPPSSPVPTTAPEPIPGDVQLIPTGPTKSVPIGHSQKVASEPAREPTRRSSGALTPVGDEHKADFRAAESLIEAGRYDEALAVYKIYARKNPGDRQARAGSELAEGLRALAQRDRLEAAQRFEAVLEIDPTNERAARELAEMRRTATNERKGLLSRLMGKKE